MMRKIKNSFKNRFQKPLIIFIFGSSFSLPVYSKDAIPFPELNKQVQAYQHNENGHILLRSSLTYNVPVPDDINQTPKLYKEEFLDLVYNNHPDIIQAKLDRQRAAAVRIEAQGAFDPSFSGSTYYNRFNSSSAPGDVQEAFLPGANIDWLSGYGAKFSLGGKLTTGDIKTPISPTGDAGEYFLKLHVPLLRNAVFNEKNVKEQQAKIKEIVEDFKLRQKIIEVLTKSIEKYWSWIGSFKILEAEQELLNLNQNQAEQVKQQVDLGSLAAIDFIEISQEVQKRFGKVASETQKYQQKALELTSFLWDKNLEPFPIVSSQSLPDINLEINDFVEPDIFEAKLTALENRPEFQSLINFKEVVDWNRKFAKNQYLPELNVYAYQGVEFGGQSIGPTSELGLELMLPFRNRRASGLLKQAKIDMSKLNVQEKQLAQRVLLEVENTAQTLTNNFNQYKAAKEQLDFATKMAEGEMNKFDLGSSTIFLVIRRQRSLLDAKINLIKTYTDFQIAQANFKFSQGLITDIN